MVSAVKTTEQIIREIDEYIRERGGGYSDWYVGIASDPEERLFNDHNIDKKSDAWIYRDCGYHESARTIERFFLDRGCQGGTGGGDHTTRYAYAYKIKPHTQE